MEQRSFNVCQYQLKTRIYIVKGQSFSAEVIKEDKKKHSLFIALNAIPKVFINLFYSKLLVELLSERLRGKSNRVILLECRDNKWQSNKGY